ncbi:MAG: sce7726 family protein [Pleomorphochaeta sp.]
MNELYIINKLFTQNNFSNLLNNNYSNKIYDCIINDIVQIDKQEFIDNQKAINLIYKYMAKNYRNEYFYQNTLFNKLLLGRHSLNTTAAISQLPINKSIADYIMINGKAVVYEIKTELDSFNRLKTQLNDYQRAFNNICVVTCEQNYSKLESLLKETDIGIYVLSDNNTLQYRKKYVENNNYLDYRTIFNILRKKEYERIIKDYYQKLPKTSQVKYYDACLKAIKAIPMNIFYSEFIKILKQRNKIDQDKFDQIPYELKSLVYFSDRKKVDFQQLSSFLSNNRSM